MSHESWVEDKELMTHDRFPESAIDKDNTPCRTRRPRYATPPGKTLRF